MCRLHGDRILGSPGSDLQAEGGVWAGRWVVLTQCSPAINHKPLPPGRHGAPARGELPRPPSSWLTLSSSTRPETARHPGSHRCQVHCLIPSVSSQGAPSRALPLPLLPLQFWAQVVRDPSTQGTPCMRTELAPRTRCLTHKLGTQPQACHTNQRVQLCPRSRWGPGWSLKLDF